MPLQLNSAAPSVDGFAWAKKHFATNNDASVCAAFAQSWLVFSLLKGEPATDAGLLLAPGVMKQFYEGKPRATASPRYPRMGTSSVDTLPASGLEIQPGYPKQPQSTNWRGLFDYLAQQPSGHYYTTLRFIADNKWYSHAMACIITQLSAYYLAPEVGMFEIPKARMAESLAGYYSQHAWSSHNQYKIYQVAPL